MLFFWLIFAHFLADFSFQTQFMGEYKAKNWLVMLAHCVVYTGIILIALYFIGCFDYTVVFDYWRAAFLLIGHGLMDQWKASHPSKPEYVWTLYVDQTWHLIQLLIVFFV